MFELQIKEQEKDKEAKFAGGALNLLKKTIESISEMVEDAELKVSDKGITLQVMDSMHVCLVNIFISKDIFNSYRCDRSLVLGIKLKNFNKIIKSIKLEKEGMFELYCDDEGSLLILNYESPSYNLSYKLKLYSFDIETYSFPEMDYPAVVSLNFEDFMLLSKSVGTFDEFLHLDATKESLTFKQKGEMGESSLALRPNQEKGIVINVTEPISKEISMKYINFMSKLNGLSESVSISLGENMPMFFDFSLHDYGYLRFYIAAKMED